MPYISPDLLALLRCPVTKASLVQDGDGLCSTAAAPDGSTPRYRIEDGILLLLRPEQLVSDNAPDAATNEGPSSGPVPDAPAKRDDTL